MVSDFNCSSNLPEIGVNSVSIPNTIFQDEGDSVLLTIYTSPSLYPDPDAPANSLTVNSSVVGVCINNLMSFVDNITVKFQLTTDVSLALPL